MTHVRLAPEVPDELAEAVLWYQARRQGLGSEFLDEVQATLPLIGGRPRSFPRLQDVNATLEICSPASRTRSSSSSGKTKCASWP